MFSLFSYYRKMTNPWQVDNLQGFTFLCCPECYFRSQEVYAFQDHALSKHPHSQVFFNDHLMQNSGEIALKPFVYRSKEQTSFQDHAPMNHPQSQAFFHNVKNEPIENDEIDQYYQSGMVIKEEHGSAEAYEEYYYDDTPVNDDPEPVEEIDLDNLDEDAPLKKDKVRKRAVKRVKKEEPLEDTCRLCHSDFSNFASLDEHVLAEHLDVDGNVKCPENDCEVTGPNYKTMVEHKELQHRKIQKKVNRFECPTCQKVFTKQIRLRNHIESVHEKKRVKCPQCNKEVGIHSIRGHMRFCHAIDRASKSFKCEECDYKSHSPLCLRNHILLKHRKEEHQFACDQCDKKYAYLSLLKNHKLIKHEGLKPYMCDQCGKSWRPDAKLLFLNHVQNGCKTNTHPDGFKCPSCEVTYKVEGKYILHHMKVHGGPPPGYADKEMFICEICSTICINKTALRAHVASMHDEKAKAKKKRHACTHCEKTFACKSACTEHIKTKHEGYTPFKCDQCHRAYGTQYGLKSHKFHMHKRIKCDECGQEVSNTLILTRHKAKAHGIKPANSYQCNYCPLFYTLETQLEKHVMNHHMNQFE